MTKLTTDNNQMGALLSLSLNIHDLTKTAHLVFDFLHHKNVNSFNQHVFYSPI